jgi:hypothetical protein
MAGFGYHVGTRHNITAVVDKKTGPREGRCAIDFEWHFEIKIRRMGYDSHNIRVHAV